MWNGTTVTEHELTARVEQQPVPREPLTISNTVVLDLTHSVTS